MDNTAQPAPVVNCHTHIFTGDHVPPYLAKTFLPAFLYRLLPLNLIVYLCRTWYKSIYPLQFRPGYKRLQRIVYTIRIFINRTFMLLAFYWIFGAWLTFQVFNIIAAFSGLQTRLPAWVDTGLTFLEQHGLLIEDPGTLSSVLLVLALWLFFPTGRNFLLFVFKKFWSILGMMPGKETKELAGRYMNIGRFAFYDNQKDVFQRLRYQYPNGTRFVILPMDMEFMDAGKVKESYYDQLKDLAALKQNCGDVVLPFIFIDPRRIRRDPGFFKYKIENDRVVLEDCTVKEYVEKQGFCGFKIYPALGYYPFDEDLLPLWRYAAEHGLPITTHCIRGTIFYRGKKKKAWDRHPVFMQAEGNDRYSPMLLPERANKDFTVNFTHPLNYLCLLDETLLSRLLSGETIRQETRDLFGYTGADQPLKHNLSKLKICFAHFGGEDEWQRYFELDRDNFSTQIIKNPDTGITFLKNIKGQVTKGKLEMLWKGTDWYSIICSMMLQYDEVYSDISYIAHDNNIHALLKRTLQQENSKLRRRVLFGTDFYVVRNHKSEKKIMADTIAGLSTEEFDLIARQNPRRFLRLDVY